MKKVIKQRWIELERGWGIRPDGVSLHLSISDMDKYIKEYWDSMPDYVPDEYSKPEGNPTEIEINEKLFEKVKESKNGIRLYDTINLKKGDNEIE